MGEIWNEYDRHKVAQMLLKEFPHLGIDKLLAAIRECDHGIKKSEGWDQLAKCTKEHLKKSGGTGVSWPRCVQRLLFLISPGNGTVRPRRANARARTTLRTLSVELE